MTSALHIRRARTRTSDLGSRGLIAVVKWSGWIPGSIVGQLAVKVTLEQNGFAALQVVEQLGCSMGHAPVESGTLVVPHPVPSLTVLGISG